MRTSKWGRYSWIVESGILDLAAAVMMIRLVRRRNELQLLGGLDGDGIPPAGKMRKTIIIVDLIRRLAGSQAFFFLALACFSKDSWIHRGIHSVWRTFVPGRLPSENRITKW